VAPVVVEAVGVVLAAATAVLVCVPAAEAVLPLLDGELEW
jgi:hypothetical protein